LLATSKSTTVKAISFVILNRYKHDTNAFTQGLQVIDGTYFLESTGQYGASTIRKVEIKSGAVKSSTSLESKYFGEGAVKVKDYYYQLTWREGSILEWKFEEKKGFVVNKTYPISGEGWGLTHDGKNFWMSDGTSELRVLDPANMKELRKVKVTLLNEPMDKLNELEWVNGKIFANIWYSSSIVRIDPKTGKIDGIIDISSLKPSELTGDAVANGIAYNPKAGTFFVTGKLWPSVYEIKLKELH
jgi:glutaminyl-peptide cyclotransferase